MRPLILFLAIATTALGALSTQPTAPTIQLEVSPTTITSASTQLRLMLPQTQPGSAYALCQLALTEVADANDPPDPAQSASALDHLQKAATMQESPWPTTRLADGENDEAITLGNLSADAAQTNLNHHDFETAMVQIQTGFAFAHQLGNSGDLACALVGAAVEDQMADVLTQWIQQPNAPNLYWAIANLPSPFINTAQIAQRETDLMASEIPMTSATQTANTDWPALVGQILTIYYGESSRPGSANPAEIARYLTIARQHFTSRGTDVSQMPAAQIVGKFLLDEMAEGNSTWKLFSLPYSQAAEGLKRQDDFLTRMRNMDPDSVLVVMTPAVQHEYWKLTQVDRKLAMLQAVEAIRAYAATHTGQPPAALNLMKDTPAPLDPSTGKEFGYDSNNGSPLISSPKPSFESFGEAALTRVTIKP